MDCHSWLVPRVLQLFSILADGTHVQQRYVTCCNLQDDSRGQRTKPMHALASAPHDLEGTFRNAPNVPTYIRCLAFCQITRVHPNIMHLKFCMLIPIPYGDPSLTIHICI